MIDDADYTRDLEHFCGPDEAAARGALDRLAPSARRFIRVVVADRLSRDDSEEITQTALLKAWVNRQSFVNLGRAARYGWLKRVARNACVDLFRSRGEEAGEPISEEEESDELPPIERFMTEIAGQELYNLADAIWLELNESASTERPDRSLVAVQLLYFEAWTMEDVLSLFSDVRPGDAPFTRGQIDAWLEAPGNLRRVVYLELLYPPDRLAAHLLGLESYEGARELEGALTSIHSGEGEGATYRDWTAQEAQAILWRYYRVVSIGEIEQHIRFLNNSALSTLFVRCALVFPFRSRCEFLCAWLDEVGVRGFGREALIGSQSGVWRRLAFEYRYRYSLPLRDIHDRIQPASDVVRYDVSLSTLNSWLSGGRLLDRLRQSHEARQVSECHA